MVFKNQDLGSERANCYWYITSPRPSQWGHEARTKRSLRIIKKERKKKNPLFKQFGPKLLDEAKHGRDSHDVCVCVCVVHISLKD